MKASFASVLRRLASWLAVRSAPAGLLGGQWSGTSFVDSYRRHRTPTPNELLAELKSTAWTCASINASVCASFAPRLYVTTQDGQPTPRCLTRALPAAVERRLRGAAHLPARHTRAARIEEVLDHP